MSEPAEFGHFTTDKADISTEAAKSFNTSTSDNLNGVNSIEIVAAADYTDLRNAIQNSGADTVNLAGVSNVKVSVDQAKAVTFKGSGGFQINDDATKIIGLANDSGKSSLLSDAQTVFASDATFEEAVTLTETGGLYHQGGVSLSVDLGSTAETKAKTGFLNVAEAKAYVLTNDYSANQEIGYRIEDTYQKINAEKGSPLLSNTKDSLEAGDDGHRGWCGSLALMQKMSCKAVSSPVIRCPQAYLQVITRISPSGSSLRSMERRTTAL